MSAVEEIKNLKIVITDEKSFKELEESLKQYHEMIQSGKLKPRESQVTSIYTPFAYISNFS